MSRLLLWGNPPAGIYNAPVYLGFQKGIFGAAGARIEVRDNLTGADYTRALVAGAYDLGHIGTPPLFAALSQTRQYVLVGIGLVRYPPFYLLVPPGVRSLRDLKGKTFALNKLQTCPHSILRTLLRQEGMGEEEVRIMTLVEGWAMVQAMGREEVEAAVLWEPYVSYVERALGWRVLAEGRKAMVPSNYGFVLYARRLLWQNEPELVREVLASYGRSVRLVRQNPSAAAPLVHEGIPHVALPDVEGALKREVPCWSEDPTLHLSFFSRILQELTLQGVVPQGFELGSFLGYWEGDYGSA